MQIALVTDSTSDLPPHILEKHHIQSIPAILIIREKEFRDSIDISRQAYYERLPDISPPPTTAAPAPGIYQNVYQQLIEDGADHILSIHASSTLSGIYNTAKLVSQSFKNRVTVVDSRQLSLGLGYQVLEAAEAISHGADIQTILDRLVSLRNRLEIHAMLDTMEQLRRSGRVSWTQAGVGNLLKLKLFIELKDGEVLRAGQVRSRTRGVSKLKEMILSFGKFERFAVLHTNAESDAKQLLDDLDIEIQHEPLLINVTTTIGTHVGVNGLGFAAVLEK